MHNPNYKANGANKILVIFILLQFQNAALAESIPKPLKGGSKSNPGAVMRLTDNGVEYIFKTAGEVVDAVLQDLEIKKMTVKLGKSIKGTIKLTDIKVYKYKKPKEYASELQPSDKMIFKVDDLVLLGVQSNIDANVMGFTLKGPLKADIEHMDVTMTMALDEDRGKPKITIKDCKIDIKNLKLHIDKLTGSGAALVKSFKRMIEKRGKGMMSDELCSRSKKMLGKTLNKRFQKLSGSLPLEKKDSKSKKSKVKFEELYNVDLGKYEFDYSYIKKPEVTKKYVESEHHGEISYRGKGRTPFHPHKLKDMSKGNTKHHIYFLLSDYSINSLLYHVNKKKGFNLKANPETVPTMKKALRTSCKGGGKCFGKMHKEAGKKFPDKDVEIEHVTSTAPYVVIEDKIVKLFYEGTLKAHILQGKNKRKTVMEGKTKGTARIRPEIKKDTIYGKASFDEFSIDVTKGDKEGGRKLQEFFRLILEQHTNAFFKEGIPLPMIEGTSLKSSKLTIKDDRALEVQTDMKLDKKKLKEMAKKEVEKALKDIKR